VSEPKDINKFLTWAEVPVILTVAEAASLLRLHSRTVYEKVERGEMPHRRLGRSIRFDRDELEAWFAEQTV
jgi:excisionase family DNA binding protein